MDITHFQLNENKCTGCGTCRRYLQNRCVNAMKRNHVELQLAEDEEGHSVLDSLEELDEQQVPGKALGNTETMGAELDAGKLTYNGVPKKWPKRSTRRRWRR